MAVRSRIRGALSTAGNEAQLLVEQQGQIRRCSRCSITIGAIGAIGGISIS